MHLTRGGPLGVPEPIRSPGQSKASSANDGLRPDPPADGADAPRQARDVIAFGAEHGRVLSDGRIVGRREPYAKVFPSSRAVKRAVGLTAWAILEDIALDAELDDQGRLVAHTGIIQIAANLGINKETVSNHLKKLRQHGFVLTEQRNSSAGFGGSFYILDPSACLERFTVTPTKDSGRKAATGPFTEIPATGEPAYGNPGNGGPGHGSPVTDEPDPIEQDVVASPHPDEEQQQPPPRPPTERARSSPDTATTRLVDELVAMGVTQAVATELVAEHPGERIRAALHAVTAKRPKRPAGWVVAAITKGWALEPAPPDRQRAAPAVPPDPPDSAAVLAYEQATDAAFTALPDHERVALEEAARTVVAHRHGAQALKSPLVGEPLVRTEIRRLVAERAGIPLPDDGPQSGSTASTRGSP
jgi:hypothetical protein